MISGTDVSKIIVAIKDLFGVTFTSAQIRSMAGLGSQRERKLCESEELVNTDDFGRPIRAGATMGRGSSGPPTRGC